LQLTAGTRDDTLKNLVKSAAGDFTMLGLGNSAMYGQLPERAVDQEHGTPFDLVMNNSILGRVARAPDVLGGKPQSMYNQATLPGGIVVPIDPSDLTGSRNRALSNDSDRQEVTKNLKAKNALIEAILKAKGVDLSPWGK
jgi:hypothetical protein